MILRLYSSFCSVRPFFNFTAKVLCMFGTSARVLKILAAITWYIGGIILFAKGLSLLEQALMINQEIRWIWYAFLAGLLIGSIKAKFIFIKSCKKNLARIGSLDQPKIWQFFRTGFFFFLALMILTGVFLSKAAQGNYIFLISAAVLDFSIGTALLGSSFVFWKRVSP